MTEKTPDLKAYLDSVELAYNLTARALNDSKQLLIRARKLTAPIHNDFEINLARANINFARIFYLQIEHAEDKELPEEMLGRLDKLKHNIDDLESIVLNKEGFPPLPGLMLPEIYKDIEGEIYRRNPANRPADAGSWIAGMTMGVLTAVITSGAVASCSAIPQKEKAEDIALIFASYMGLGVIGIGRYLVKAYKRSRKIEEDVCLEKKVEKSYFLKSRAWYKYGCYED